MKSRISIWKLAALISSLLLMAGFVADQAGAFDSNASENPAMLPGSKLKQILVPPDTPASVSDEVDPKFLPPSKALGNLGVGRSGKPGSTNPGAPGFHWDVVTPPTPPNAQPTEAKP